MLHLKNITAGNPKTAEQYQLTKKHGIKWLFSEDGKNWYREQKKFSPDTIKIAYLPSGRVFAVEKDVTGIDPEGLSIIELPDITAYRRIEADGYWFYRNDEFALDYKLKAEDERNALLVRTSTRTGEWEKDLLLGIISDEDKENLKAWRICTKELQAMDFSKVTDKSSYAAIVWPELPQNINEN